MSTTPITLRWSSLFAFMKCQRRFDLTYRQGWQKQAGTDSRALILGSAIHAGIQSALILSFRVPKATQQDLVVASREGARKYIKEATDPKKTTYDWERRQFVLDTAYLQMMKDIEVQALNVLQYQIPRIGLGTKYRVATVEELFPPLDVSRTPMIEWQFSEEFELENGNRYTITGTVDTVLRDLETGDYVLVDWKSRSKMPEERLVDLDGQLRLYGSIINLQAGENLITRTIQYQMYTAVPSPAKLTEKTRRLSMASISTTEAVWTESVRALGLDPEPYLEQMRPKFHSEDHFTKPIVTPLTPTASRLALNNALMIGEAIRFAEESGNYPGIPSSMGCQFCPFKSYCRVLDTGGDTAFILNAEYVQTDVVGEEPEEDVA